MIDTPLVMYDDDHRKILAVLQRLVRDANAKGIFLVDKNGQLVAEAGEMRGIDSTSLASLTAGNIAATGGLAKIIGEEEFPIHFHQVQRDNLQKAGAELGHIFEEIRKKTERAQAAGTASPFAEITDDDIDNLFSE